MKEQKVGKKPHGMVLVISVGKPGGKKPEREADPDTKKKAPRHPFRENRRAGLKEYLNTRRMTGPLTDPNAPKEPKAPKLADDVSSGHGGGQGSKEEAEAFESGKPLMQRLQEEEEAKKPKTEEEDLYANIFDSINRAGANVSKASEKQLLNEAATLREMGDKRTARRFSDVAGLMSRGPALRESSIQRLGTKAAQALDPDEKGQDDYARLLFDESTRGADYQDMKLNPKFYPPEMRREVMKLISQMARQGTQADIMDEKARLALDKLREEDPTQFFADQDFVQRSYENLEALDAMMKGEPVNFCTCCSPADIAWAVTKAKKKSKPFHGYNPNRHHKKGGLNAKGRAKFKRETGANLKPPVTKKPSKLKPGSKSAKRRKSFCARMGGMKGPTSKKGKLTPKGAALKRWNC